MQAKETPMSDERAVETGQHSEPAKHSPGADTIGYFEPHQLTKLAQNGRLYVIADSVGGAASGQVASQYAVKKILYTYYEDENPNLEERLLNAIKAANSDIFERNLEHPGRRLLATTIMAALIHDNKLLVASVGDSRVYVVWDQDIEWLNSDLPKKTDDGADKEEAGPALLPAETPDAKSSAKVSTADLEGSLQRRLPAALGVEKTVEIKTYSRRLFAGDIVVLCSGSLTGYVQEGEIARAMTKHTPDQAIRRLVALAAERGNRSHVSINVTRVLSSPVAMRTPLPMVPPNTAKWSDWEVTPRPGPAPTIDKPATRPLSKPVPPPPPVTSPLTKPPNTEIPLSPPRSRWQGCLLIAVVLVLLCAVTIAAAQFLVPEDLQANIPFFQDLQTLTESVATPELTEEAITTSEAATEDTAAPQAATETGLTTEATTSAESTAPESTAATVSESGSPLPTPTVIASEAIDDTEGTGDTVPAAETSATEPTAVAEAAGPTPTPAPTIEVPANCENKARYVTDVTVDDGTEFGPGATFDKVWRVRNEGSCPWGAGYTIRFLNGDSFGTLDTVPLTEFTETDQTYDITVPMVAPGEAGDYRGVWQLYDLQGQPFGPTMYLEIVVAAGAPTTGAVDSGEGGTLYDFIDNAAEASWSSGQVSLDLLATNVSDELELPESGGLVAIGSAVLRGNTESDGNVLLTYPHQELGFISGDYVVDVPLQPGDAIQATIGFPKLSILSDDGVTFEVSFTPDDGSGQIITVLSQPVQYRESPVTAAFPLTDITAGQTGTFTLRVLAGESTSSDWAVWMDLRLVRP